MFQLLPCSNCQRTFSLRDDVSEETWLKCPNCGNQFRLGDVLDAFYAPWQVVPAPSSPLAPAAVASSFDDDALELTQTELEPATELTPEQLHAADEFEMDLSEEEPSLDSQPLSLDGQIPEATAPPSPSEAGRPSTIKARARSAKGPSIWTLVQVMLGGAASIPVTLLLLWHVVGKDVMNAGPAVAQFAPWIVPAKFHHTSMPDIPTRPTRPNINPPARGDSGFRNFDDVMPMDGDKLATPNTNEPAEAQPPEPVKPPVETDTVTPELFARAKSVKEKISQYDPEEKDPAVKVSRLTAIMDDLSVIAEKLPEVPSEGGAARLLSGELKSIGRALTADPKIEDAIKSSVRAQFNGAMKRQGTGRVYLGTASDLTEEGDHWLLKHTEPQAGKIPGYNLEANIDKRLAESLEAGAKVLVLGKLTPSEVAPSSVQIAASYIQQL